MIIKNISILFEEFGDMLLIPARPSRYSNGLVVLLFPYQIEFSQGAWLVRSKCGFYFFFLKGHQWPVAYGCPVGSGNIENNPKHLKCRTSIFWDKRALKSMGRLSFQFYRNE